MKKILRNSIWVLFVVMPLLSLNSGGRVELQSNSIRKQNDSLYTEGCKLRAELKVLLDQSKYKDSVDAVRGSKFKDTLNKFP